MESSREAVGDFSVTVSLAQLRRATADGRPDRTSHRASMQHRIVENGEDTAGSQSRRCAHRRRGRDVFRVGDRTRIGRVDESNDRNIGQAAPPFSRPARSKIR
jgi:hypothetical protein